MGCNTNITINAGGDLAINNQSGCKVSVLVVRSDTGEHGYQEVDQGATVGDIVGDTNQEVRVNGQPAEANQEVQQDDKISVTPANPEGN